MIVVLMGYMGVGKTSIGSALAKQLNYRFIDLDEHIQNSEGMKITELFRTKGELYFRKLETKYLQNLLDVEHNLVLALGGGTPCYGNNLKRITSSKNVKSFYLKLSIPNLVTRLSKEKKTRPLIAHITDETQLSEFVGKHLFERGPFYNEADVVIDCNSKTLNEIINSIETHLV